MKILIVGGTYDADGGQFSSLVSLIAGVVRDNTSAGVELVNGGTVEHLEQVADTVVDYEAIVWMPNVDNSEDKILPSIKKLNPKAILVQSKRVVEKQYTDFELVGRLLASHSALGLIVRKGDDDRYLFSLIDPLGNVWIEDSDMKKVAKMLTKRIVDIANMTRMRSVKVGEKTEEAPLGEFLDVVHEMGRRFDDKITAINPDRYLGNASMRVKTRCSYGFPSMRGEDDTIFVTRRNVNKETLGTDDFVPVKLGENENGEDQVEYLGENKPSVDTLVQCLLYDFFKEANYMVHGHCYVEGAPFTQHNVPCGFLEEVNEIIYEIVKNFPIGAKNYPNIAFNLRGHGCLIIANDLDFILDQKLVSRPFLEEQK